MGSEMCIRDSCFEGIEKGSVVAVSTYMASEHDNRQDQKAWFMAGYNEMLRRIEPEKIICYNTPFPEMQGNIVPVDYERSSWRYMSYERSFHKNDLDAFKIDGAPQLSCDTIDLEKAAEVPMAGNGVQIQINHKISATGVNPEKLKQP